MAHVRLARRSFLRAAGAAGAGTALGLPLLAGCGSGTPSAGDRVRLGTTQIMQFDPYQTNTGLHIHAFYTYLISYGGGYEPRPSGAESWEFADDHRSVTITLRPGTFHSGRDITAADVVAGVERAKDPAQAFTMAQPSAFIASATALDRHRVRLDFTGPTPEELVLDWMYAFPLVPADRNDAASLANEPAGSGPYRLETFERDERLVLTRNPDVWPGERPRLDQVEVRFFRDEDSLVSALESGDVDGALYVALRHDARLREHFTVVEGPGHMNLFFMNATLPPFDNKRLRQALARAVDRERIIEQVGFGLGEPVYTAFTPDSPAFDASYLRRQSFDLDAAEAMLREAGGPMEATAGVGDEPGAVEILQILQHDFERIGFRLTIDPMEQTTFLERLFASELQCAVAAQPNNLQSPSLVARGRQMLPTEDNVMLGADVPAAYTEAVRAAATAVTPEAQRDAYARLNEVLVDEAWAVGLATSPSLNALDPDVTGLSFDRRDYVRWTGLRRG
ncbi:ABC transporter substrate-binding protein [Streptomyces sp. 7-21]|jgi:peptide/nickel transport system substrate-binding protein|uniref:ABC transporter substrate-binding protein n=1 Tax=Streptomyces sp. 7-21 TaxID=2802283 RepID=UPI00191E516E|nr:ABC transporter substrate-binding protein [Streptomyces sp. 7-21]MBL1065136.1 ABC transporter substrate-binding protein [Streptomyces sp. 7-21]